VAPAQRAAIAKWAAPRERPYDYLKAIQQPTLVVNGSNDVIIYIYPDPVHGSHHQYPALFVADVTRFLDAEVPFPIHKETDHG
jgi:hypothetical protein